MSSVAINIEKIHTSIKHAAIACLRDPSEIQLLAVSKTQPISAIEEAIKAGQYAFGENYAQEGVKKIDYFKTKDSQSLQWHFIGPLQSNKTRLIAEHFDWVHTIEREKIALRLSEQRPRTMPPLNVLIQININQEATKSGVDEQELDKLAMLIASLPHLTLRGLMAIPDGEQSQKSLKQTFNAMQHLFNKLQQLYPTIDTLSMGMSHDFPLAIEEGSTLIRIGQAIFGERH